MFMDVKSFVSYISGINNTNYSLAVGLCCSWEYTRFIELEYTDNGIIIHYYNYNCNEFHEKSKQKYLQYKTNSAERYSEFYCNIELIKLLKAFTKMGCEYHHTQSCDCGACCLLPKNLYIFSFDVIKIVKKLFEQHKDNQTI